MALKVFGKGIIFLPSGFIIPHRSDYIIIGQAVKRKRISPSHP